jgi:hypothetical protein
MTVNSDPSVVATELASKLSARSRHVCLLLGAGVSRSAGLPDLHGLQEAVEHSHQLDAAQQALVKGLFKTRNLENALSYLRRLTLILEAGNSLNGFTVDTAESLHKAITRAIISALDHTSANLAPFIDLATWVAGGYYHLPVELFTINYDLLIETGLEELGVPYFDGFVGSVGSQFHPELVDAMAPSEPGQTLPSNFVRVWKLHGSMNWEETNRSGRRCIVRRGSPISASATAAIYPSDEKYDQSRRVPFVVLMDRFRRALAVPETIVIVCGYSFGDQHLNEMLFDAARSYPRSETVVLCFDDIPATVSTVASMTRNITVLARKAAVIGGQPVSWARPDDIPGLWVGGNFLLGDFRELSRFLATKARAGSASA